VVARGRRNRHGGPKRELKKALFIEVKCSDLTSRKAEKVLKSLEKKAELVGLDDYEKHFGIIAKKLRGKKTLSWPST